MSANFAMAARTIVSVYIHLLFITNGRRYRL